MIKCHKDWFKKWKWKLLFICITYLEKSENNGHDLAIFSIKVKLAQFCYNLVGVGVLENFSSSKGGMTEKFEKNCFKVSSAT